MSEVDLKSGYPMIWVISRKWDESKIHVRSCSIEKLITRVIRRKKDDLRAWVQYEYQTYPLHAKEEFKILQETAFRERHSYKFLFLYNGNYADARNAKPLPFIYLDE